MSGYYSPGSETAGAGAQTDARITALTARYNGVVNAQIDWGKNQKAGPTAPATVVRPGDLTGVKIGVGYPYMPGAQVAVFVVNSEQAESSAVTGFTAAGDKVKQRGMGVNWEHVFGNVQALAQFARVNKATGCTDSGATANPGLAGTTCDKSGYTGIMGGARYLLSKRTSVYTTYARITNEANANADFAPAGYTSISGTVPAGVDPRVWAFGVMHNF
jgi:predicted porin